jgi:hypothetical protein
MLGRSGSFGYHPVDLLGHLLKVCRLYGFNLLLNYDVDMEVAKGVV